MSILLLGLFLFPVAAAVTKDHLILLRTIHGFIFIHVFIIVGIKCLFDYISKYQIQVLLTHLLVFLIFVNGMSFSIYYFYYYPDKVKKKRIQLWFTGNIKIHLSA